MKPLHHSAARFFGVSPATGATPASEPAKSKPRCILRDLLGDVDVTTAEVRRPDELDAGPDRSFVAALALLLLTTTPPAGAQLATDDARLLAVGDGGISGSPTELEGFGHAIASGDFDCDGLDDLAIGAPGTHVQGPMDVATAAGVVHVIYGAAEGPSTRTLRFHEGELDHPEARTESNDGFGTVLSAGNFDGDSLGGNPCEDLVVGGPAEGLEDRLAAGVVWVVYGSPAGIDLLRVQGWSQGSPGVRGVRESNDRFGEVLATGDVDGDGFDDLAIGTPREALDDGPGEGAVWVLRGGPSGLEAPNINDSSWRQLIHQDLNDVMDEASSGDLFGASLALCDVDGDGFDDLAVGVPGEDHEFPDVTLAAAGGIQVFFGSALGIDLTGNTMEAGLQESGRMGGSLVGGELDLDEAGCEIAVGHPGRTVSILQDERPGAGLVTVHKPVRFGPASGTVVLILTQSDFPGEEPEAEERFGASLGSGDFDGDGIDELLIGSPGEGSLSSYGAVFWYPIADLEKVPYRAHDFVSVADAQEIARFGEVLTSGDTDGDGRPELLVGLPFYSTEVSGGRHPHRAGATLWIGPASSAIIFRDGFEGGDVRAWSSGWGAAE